jgi:hypothetical protein
MSLSLAEIIERIRIWPIEDAVYFAMSFLNPHKDAWQYWDMIQAIKVRELNWIRSRGGSKTDDAVELAIILGLRFGNGGWYSPDGGQLEEAQLRLREYRPWVRSWRNNRINLLTGSRIIFGNYSGRKGLRGPRNNWLISDEEGEISMDLKVLKGYDGAMGTTSNTINAIKLHMGTPKLGSKLYDNSQLFPTLIRPAENYCHWVNTAQYEHMPQWWKDNELGCKWTAPSGNVFRPITNFVWPSSYDLVTQGIDFNGSSNDNILSRIGWLGLDTYILKEDVFQYKTDDELLQQACNHFPTEGEGGGWNLTYAPKLTGITTFPFTRTGNQMGVKEQIIGTINKGNLYCDPKLTPITYKHICAAVWDHDQTVKVNALHHLAAVLHAKHKIIWGQGRVFKEGVMQDG